MSGGKSLSCWWLENWEDFETRDTSIRSLGSMQTAEAFLCGTPLWVRIFRYVMDDMPWMGISLAQTCKFFHRLLQIHPSLKQRPSLMSHHPLARLQWWSLAWLPGKSTIRSSAVSSLWNLLEPWGIRKLIHLTSAFPDVRQAFLSFQVHLEPLQRKFTTFFKRNTRRPGSGGQFRDTVLFVSVWSGKLLPRATFQDAFRPCSDSHEWSLYWLALCALLCFDCQDTFIFDRLFSAVHQSDGHLPAKKKNREKVLEHLLQMLHSRTMVLEPCSEDHPSSSSLFQSSVKTLFLVALTCGHSMLSCRLLTLLCIMGSLQDEGQRYHHDQLEMHHQLLWRDENPQHLMATFRRFSGRAYFPAIFSTSGDFALAHWTGIEPRDFELCRQLSSCRHVPDGWFATPEDLPTAHHTPHSLLADFDHRRIGTPELAASFLRQSIQFSDALHHFILRSLAHWFVPQDGHACGRPQLEYLLEVIRHQFDDRQYSEWFLQHVSHLIDSQHFGDLDWSGWRWDILACLWHHLMSLRLVFSADQSHLIDQAKNTCRLLFRLILARALQSVSLMPAIRLLRQLRHHFLFPHTVEFCDLWNFWLSCPPCSALATVPFHPSEFSDLLQSHLTAPSARGTRYGSAEWLALIDRRVIHDAGTASSSSSSSTDGPHSPYHWTAVQTLKDEVNRSMDWEPHSVPLSAMCYLMMVGGSHPPVKVMLAAQQRVVHRQALLISSCWFSADQSAHIDSLSRDLFCPPPPHSIVTSSSSRTAKSSSSLSPSPIKELTQLRFLLELGHPEFAGLVDHPVKLLLHLIRTQQWPVILEGCLLDVPPSSRPAWLWSSDDLFHCYPSPLLDQLRINQSRKPFFALAEHLLPLVVMILRSSPTQTRPKIRHMQRTPFIKRAPCLDSPFAIHLDEFLSALPPTHKHDIHAKLRRLLHSSHLPTR